LGFNRSLTAGKSQIKLIRMKKLLVFVGLTIAIAACQSAGSQQKKADNTVSTAEKITPVTPDELFGTPEKYAGQAITV
jgi:hypothetical protein